MSNMPSIPDSEYEQRVRRAAELTAEKGLDLLIANANEADFANSRYLSGYWPLFEIGGVALAPSGQAALMVGPESEAYARDRSRIPNIHLMVVYRESADPAYPGMAVSSFNDGAESVGVRAPARIGVAGYLVTLCAAPTTPATLAAAFVLFRFFDIAKPWPVRRFESLPGAWGVMADDIAAGVYAALCLQGALWLFPGLG